MFSTLGSSPGLSDIQNYTLSTDTFTNITNLNDLLVHGDIMYTTVICLNGAGYAVSAISDGVTLLSIPPAHQASSIVAYNPALTECPARDQYVSSDSVQFVWNRFEDSSNAPHFYEMKIVKNGESADTVEWKDVDSLKQVTVTGLSSLSVDVPHTVFVRAYAVQGLYSEPIKETFTIISSPPIVKGIVLLPCDNVWTLGSMAYI